MHSPLAGTAFLDALLCRLAVIVYIEDIIATNQDVLLLLRLSIDDGQDVGRKIEVLRRGKSIDLGPNRT